MRAWAPKSPIVTGEASSLDRVPLALLWKTFWVRMVARWTARRAVESS